MAKKPSNNRKKKFSRKAGTKDLELARLQKRFAKRITERINDCLDDERDRKALKQIDKQFLRFMQDIHKLHSFKAKESGMEAQKNKEDMIFRNGNEPLIPEAESARHMQRYECHNE